MPSQLNALPPAGTAHDMDDSPLQTALCLIGHPIGGNPTQFVVTRVLAAMQLDWQFLSFDVEPDQFGRAIAGIDALGFFGAMIAAPYRTEVAAVLGQLYGEQDSVIEGINDSIFRGPNGKFVAVNLWAIALEQTLQAHEQTSHHRCLQSICITDEEDLSDVLNQFSSTLPPKQFFIRDSQLVGWPIVEPAEVPVATELAATPAPPPDEANVSSTHETQPLEDDDDTAINAPAPDPAAFDDQMATLVIWHVNGKPSRKATQIGTAKIDAVKDSIRKLPAGSLLVDLSCSYEIWMGRQETTPFAYVSRVDLKLRRLALAIQRWTGREPNFEIMREAIEEYLEI